MKNSGRGFFGWIKWVFAGGGRLRSGWRVLLYLIASLLLIVLGSIALQIGVGVVVGTMLVNQGLSNAEAFARIRDMFTNFFNYPFVALGIESQRLLLGLGLIWIFRRAVDRRPFRALGLQLTNGWWKEFGSGFGLTIAMWLIIFVLALGLGAAQIGGYAWNTRDAASLVGALAVGLIFNLMTGVIEETDARGYILQNLAEGTGIVPAILLSSIYFGLLHLLNPGAGLGSTLGIFFAGVLLAMGYYATRRLWFSIGMHAAWNFAEGPLFGFLVSGINMGGLVQLNISGPEWLTGGAFGPEAGALTIVPEIIVITLLFVWGRNRTRARALSYEKL